MKRTFRNRTLTIQRIVNALEEVIMESGLEKVGVNRIAKKANVSKVLIYRYFGGLNGLLAHYIKVGGMYPVYSADVLTQIQPIDEHDLARVWHQHAIQIFRRFRIHKASREILRAAALTNDETIDIVSESHDKELIKTIEQLAFINGVDYQAISAIIFGGMSYMTLLAQNNRNYVGIDLRSNEGWKRIENALKVLYVSLNKMASASPEVNVELQKSEKANAVW